MKISRGPEQALGRSTAEDVALSGHPHPTLSETLGEGAELFTGQATYG